MIFQEKAMTILQEYVDWVQRTQFEQIPDKLVTLAKYSIIDTIAVSYMQEAHRGMMSFTTMRQADSQALWLPAYLFLGRCPLQMPRS